MKITTCSPSSFACCVRKRTLREPQLLRGLPRHGNFFPEPSCYKVAAWPIARVVPMALLHRKWGGWALPPDSAAKITQPSGQPWPIYKSAYQNVLLPDLLLREGLRGLSWGQSYPGPCLGQTDPCLDAVWRWVGEKWTSSLFFVILKYMGWCEGITTLKNQAEFCVYFSALASYVPCILNWKLATTVWTNLLLSDCIICWVHWHRCGGHLHFWIVRLDIMALLLQKWLMTDRCYFL